ncbi:tRNA (adenosine(37)-N6)-dimethylallyltransferase MiaA [Halioglobus japonicus]|uniref:tRNA dimethylallyltransferase n=1 Tax=Halioglobus japonicus TaxID=930805 RepID=A0AAP8SLS3_9GAMM|nr:tRNA (adenosine(37)-N6)-dimethylallyltransferase MiaA [Halioglobus japonicus]AQA16943.1 tRNA (adenosine(37)-N6)-dimethylallyltransferase MiaA [Halioglobus japonicus]PLW84827.1 tRNA (adenosine(37)-N6)-dimethylallyltransferase MiaA [Halioglobus japonicus]GHD21607.1 tRNA dimethylallyltransferase [Halioglobus japonicus]
MSKPPLICLMGPTASGKTDLAIALCEQLNCELVSVDSALVYRGLDIGSAKPDYPHHLVDIRDPADPYSAADFAADANRLAVEITSRGKIPLLVGGTMLYFKAFLEPMADMPPADPAIRASIEAEATEHGWPHIHAELAKVDPAAAARIHPNHSQRLARALEVYRATGKPMSEWHELHQNSAPVPADTYDIKQLVICPTDRAVLHQRIALRYELMMQAGFLDEVKALQERGDLTSDLPALRAVGYRQLWEHLEGQTNLEEAVEKGIAATRQLAKRQLTWLRKWPDLAWTYTDADGNLKEFVSPEEPSPDVSGLTTVEATLNYLNIAPM